MGDRVRIRSLGNRLSVLIASVAVIKHPDQKQLGAQKHLFGLHVHVTVH